MNKSNKLKGGQAVVQALKKEKTKHVFGLIGSATMEIFDALYHEKDIKFIGVRDERTGTHMADGYARASNKPGVILAGQNGPGATNLVTGIAQAAAAFSPVISISLEEKQQSSTGTAFSIDSSGTWITARHVADGCDKIALQKGYRKFIRIGRVWHHPNSDISVLKTSGGSPPFSGIQKHTSRGEHGYSFGFPKGKPGDVYGQIIGKRTMRVEGRYSTREPVLAWTQIQRVPDMGPHLGGISGGP